jgi:hypothetical protein
MEPFIDHIEITVRDLSTAIPFYDRLLPLLGFDLRNRSEAIIEGPRSREPLRASQSTVGSPARSIILRSGPGRGLMWTGCISNCRQ